MPHIFEKVVKDVTAVPAPFQPFYKKNDAGEFQMDDELFGHLDTSGLRSALEKERTGNSGSQKALKPWLELGENPDVVRQQIAQLKEELGKKDTTAGQFEKFKSEVEKNHAQALAAKDTEVAAMRKSLEAYLIDAEATSILAAEKGSPTLLLPIIRSHVKVVEENGKFSVRVVDGEGDPRYNPANGQLFTMTDFVKELRAHAEYSKAFEPTGPSGSGMRPGSASPKPRTTDPATLSANDKIRLGLQQQGR